FGFGTRIYSAKEFRREFYKLLSCYVESGIPIVIAIENDEEKRIGHAVLCVGHKKIEHNQVENLVEEIIRDETARIDLLKREISIYDYDNLNKEFVFVDDNMPVFQKALLAEPAKYYEDPDWGKCKITHFVVPLYPKNYLEAYEAKNFIQNFLSKKFLPIPDNTKLFVRTFLASGRSYKNAIALDPDISEDIRTLICETAMPKFIWVTELATKDLIKIEKAEGLVILDATEARVTHLKPLLLAAYENSVLYYDSENKVFAKNNIPLSRFGTYKNNLIRF
ncbi:MAG: hypothetical protein KKA07_17705, partial [Bacteroidetes bacterium]|nr:hypothetical protein [Bacteroidota bacterium]